MSGTERVLDHRQAAAVRAGLFTVLLLMINLVVDGLPKVLPETQLQLLLLPYTLIFLLLSATFLRPHYVGTRLDGLARQLGGWWNISLSLLLVAAFQILGYLVEVYCAHHYAKFGYQMNRPLSLIVFGSTALALGSLAVLSFKRRDPATQPVNTTGVAVTIVVSYVAGLLLAIANFPLNYLRSDMFAVIEFANRSLLVGRDPYMGLMIYGRYYDFPYLPGMILAFTPFQAINADLRFGSMFYVVGLMALVIWTTLPRFRTAAAVLCGTFILCPFVQYRHDLYTQGHWFSLVVMLVLLHRKQYVWSAIAFGVSMAISQFSWILFPFFLMYALRRGGWPEVLRMALVAGAAAACILVPFQVWGSDKVGRNAVTQWYAVVRPNARPMNLSYFVSYVVPASKLQWLQLVLLTGMFCYAWARGRCAEMASMLRWMIAAWILFIMLNVLVDGYFYLMLLVPMLVYVCVANGWWNEEPEAAFA